MSNIVFVKSGLEIKTAVQKRRQQLEARLNKRNQALDEFLKDERKVRSYLIRSSERGGGYHGGGAGYVLFAPGDISSEEKQEIDQLRRRIFEIEQELRRLALLTTHLRDEDNFKLEYEDLIGYGFDATLEGGRG